MDADNDKRQNQSSGMNELELQALWNVEKPTYAAWGDFILGEVIREIEEKGMSTDVFFKIPAKPRLKDNKSLVDKAFFRDKGYKSPYLEIEDKVGVRFVVLLLEQINFICKVIENNPKWQFDPCKHFNHDKEKEPLLFTYQSVHYILRPKENIIHNGQTITVETSCEVQIRTLLQHAHAELTHDAIYKSKKKIKPKVHRTVAKSMALIETTDEFFEQVTHHLNHGPLQAHEILPQLDALYIEITGTKPITQKSSLYIWDEFEQYIDDKLITDIRALVKVNAHVAGVISTAYANIAMYQQSIILFIYWMLKKHKSRLISDWPLDASVLERIATEFGITIRVE